MPTPIQSERHALDRRAARQAGRMHPAVEDSSKVTMTEANTVASSGLVAQNSDRISRVTPALAAIPIKALSAPGAVHPVAPDAALVPGSAPKAMRMPISGVR